MKLLRNWTLIDTLTVIAIVGMIAAFAIPLIVFTTEAAPQAGLAVSEPVGTVSPNGYNQNLIHVINLRGHDYFVLIGTTHPGNAMIHAESCACRKHD